MTQRHTLHVAIPAMNEADHLPDTLKCLMQQQATQQVVIWICVNQPDQWWDEPAKAEICENNRRSLHYLESLGLANIHIIDHSSRGRGWQGKNCGVGQARKVLMDTINQNAGSNDIIVSLDADTTFGPGYLESIDRSFHQNPGAVALSNPYYHKLSGNEILDRAMLRYEIYMRHYAINMWGIGSPYSFTALGSAIALPLKSYRKIGGMTPKKSGEDFYLLQKLRKTGWLINYNKQYVFPGTRFSDRVFFGTGPALIKGSQGNWNSYPIYNHNLFNKVEKTYDLFGDIYHSTRQTPMSDFLKEQFRCDDIFLSLRQNSKSIDQFRKACHHRIDGLRILQFLKSSQPQGPMEDENNLKEYFTYFFNQPSTVITDYYSNGSDDLPPTFESGDHRVFPDLLNEMLQDSSLASSFIFSLEKLDFQTSSLDTLIFIRNLQCNIERIYQLMDLKDAKYT